MDNSVTQPNRIEELQQKYKLSEDELRKLIELSGNEFTFGETYETSDIELKKPENFMQAMIDVVLSEKPVEFARWVAEHHDEIDVVAVDEPEIIEALVLCYRLGIQLGSSECATDLGGHYYMGNFVKQDYAKAADFYMLGANLGCDQALVNLGYIYEYGRMGEPDYQKAYDCYTLASALYNNGEAIYKLGDMYSRGKNVPADKRKAYALWEKSLRLAHYPEDIAQPAFRIAEMLIDPQSEELSIECNPLRALDLFQRAEIGLRISVGEGAVYYEERLGQAIAGQEKARALLDASADNAYPVLENPVKIYVNPDLN